MKKTVRFGIFGLGRGAAFYQVVLANNGSIVAAYRAILADDSIDDPF